MIPQSTFRNEPVQEIEQPSRTWKIDFNKKRIVGMTDGLDAIKQTVFCILRTERFRYLILSFDYGNELHSVIGLSPLFVESEIARMIREALMQDDRITDAQNFSMERNGDSLKVNFTVITNVGSFDEGVEVNV